MIIYIPIIISFISLGIATCIAVSIERKKCENKKINELSSFIRQGAITFLNEEYKILIIFVIIIFGLLYFFLSKQIAIAFISGALFSAIAGNIGMRMATIANAKTVWAIKKNLQSGFKIAFNSGSIMGLTVSGLGLLGISVLYFIFHDPEIIYGFGFGASSIALFARVGGGIYTKAADVGADLVGKVEANIPEDDPRNPATIADNVGDNVGDVAGMGADLFESYVDSIIATMVLGAVFASSVGSMAVAIPLILASIGIIASILGIITINLIKKGEPTKILNKGVLMADSLMVIGSFVVLKLLITKSSNIFGALITGLLSGIIIGFFTEYITSAKYKPTKELARSSTTGAGINVISGLALGMQSTYLPVIIISIAILVSYKLSGLYGIGIAATGMLSTLAITLATDTCGPIVDNAQGIAEMSKMDIGTKSRCEKLDSIGNTTAAIGKGFAIGSAALTALILSTSYVNLVGLKMLDLNQPKVIVGLFIGGFLPFLFSSFVLKAVSQAASKIVIEVRRQFREIKGLIENKVTPDYNHCIRISTKMALKKMILPGIIIILMPIMTGFLLGKEALGGLLIGTLLSGFLLAITMANSGSAWDNAKKYIEQGNFGGKGSDSYKAAVIGDTVGDPLKDAAGPSLNILIKLISIISLIIAPLL